MGYYTGKLIGQFEIQTLLPSTYQQVEYIESTGTQFVNTGIVANAGTRWEIKYAYTNTYNQAQNGASGQVGVINSSRFIFASLNNSLYMAIGISFNWSKPLDFNPHIYILDKPNNKTWIDSESITVSNSFTSSVEKLYIFNRNTISGDNYKHNGKCYYSKIYNNNVLIQHLIPCYRKSDAVIGMYDIINNTFIINIGTGTFLKGSNL